MTTAVVFDSAGTLLDTYRVAKNVLTGELRKNIETITLTYSCDKRALLLIYAHSRDIIDADPDMLLSGYLRASGTGFGIACACRAVTVSRVESLLYNDDRAKNADLQECIRTVWKSCKKEAVVAMNSGVMVNEEVGGIEFVITAGGRPFPGAKSTIALLQERGVATYVASGDRTDKLIRMADYLGIPHDNIYGVATPAIKEQVIDELKRRYDTVVMVGDGINDLRAMKRADFAILSEQQSKDKPLPLKKAADFTITSVSEVAEIIESLP